MDKEWYWFQKAWRCKWYYCVDLENVSYFMFDEKKYGGGRFCLIFIWDLSKTLSPPWTSSIVNIISRSVRILTIIRVVCMWRTNVLKWCIYQSRNLWSLCHLSYHFPQILWQLHSYWSAARSLHPALHQTKTHTQWFFNDACLQNLTLRLEMRQGCSRRSLKQTAVTSCCTAVLKSRVLEERRPRHSCEKVWHMVTCRAGSALVLQKVPSEGS